MPPLKRPAAAGSSSGPKPKKQKQQPRLKLPGRQKLPKQVKEIPKDPLITKCDTIASALLQAECCEEDTRQMLAKSVRLCFSNSKDMRDDVQSSVIDMISDVLSGVEAGHLEKVAVVQAKIAEANAQTSRLEGEVEAAETAAHKKVEAVQAASKRREEALAAHATASQEHFAASNELQGFDGGLLKVEKKIKIAKACRNDDFGPLIESTAEDAEVAIRRLSAVLVDLGLETQIILTAAAVLRKPAGDRAAFDGVVIDQVDEQMAAAISKLGEGLKQVDAHKKERAAKVEACKSEAEAADQHVKKCKSEVIAAKVATTEADTARKAADAALQDHGPAIEQAAAELAAAGAVLVACRADLDTFKALVEGAPVVQEPNAKDADDAAQLEARAVEA